MVTIAMVEPEPVEAARLRSKFAGIQVIESALGSQDWADSTLYVCSDPILSSLYRSDLRFLSRFSHAPRFEVVGTETIRLCRFDSLVDAGKAQVPDFLKLDVQGYELEVLLGFGELLDQVLAIELEAQFFAHYQDQPLFGDINAYLMDRGFGLLAIRPQGVYDEACIADSNCFFARDWRKLDEGRRRKLELWRRLMRIPTSLDMTLATG